MNKQKLIESEEVEVLVYKEDFYSEVIHIKEQIDYLKKNHISVRYDSNDNTIFKVKTYKLDESIKVNKEN